VADLVIKKHKDLLLPPQLNQKDYINLPETPGVYYFWDAHGHLLYVGKSKNIRKRIQSHFRLNTKIKRDIELKKKLASITHQETGNELAALLLEAQEIISKRPRFNIANRYRHFTYTIRRHKDDEGFIYLTVCRKMKQDDDHLLFRSRKSAADAKEAMLRSIFALPTNDIIARQSLANLKKTLGQDAFNAKIDQYYHNQEYPSANMYLQQPGRIRGEVCTIVIEDHCLQRIEFPSEDTQEQFSLEETPYMKKLVLQHL